VKLDMQLVRNVHRDPAREALVAGMVHFAAASGCELIAEGIETEQECRALMRLGVKLGQGFLLGRPDAMIVAA
jgi:EAL domain-containing protein (putative c-di-GMP-specific phosphodiesterase class I)